MNEEGKHKRMSNITSHFVLSSMFSLFVIVHLQTFVKGKKLVNLQSTQKSAKNARISD